MKRLLPVVLESGQTVDLPLLSAAVFKNIDNLEIWMEDFDDKKFYISGKEIADMQRKVAEP